MPKHIILAGAGHANIAALRRLAKSRPDAEITLINESPKAWYTGALPALIRGDIAEAEAHIDLPALAARCGARFLAAKVTGFQQNRLGLEHHEPLRFDILALAIGAKLDDGVKPVEKFLARVKTWDSASRPDIGIVGGGAAGVELALALRVRLGAKARIAIRTQDEILESAPSAVRRAALDHLRRAKISVQPRFVVRMDDVIHAYSPAPANHIRETLQLTSRDDVFAAGDCAEFPTPLPRSGAIAVRQGRTLATNIRRALAGKTLEPFIPPKATLAILSLDAQTAAAWYGRFAWVGKAAMRLKHRLDAEWIG